MMTTQQYEAAVETLKYEDAINRPLAAGADAAIATTDDIVDVLFKTACDDSAASRDVRAHLDAAFPPQVVGADRKAKARSSINQLQPLLLKAMQRADKKVYSQLAGSFKRVLMIFPINELDEPVRMVRLRRCVALADV